MKPLSQALSSLDKLAAEAESEAQKSVQSALQSFEISLSERLKSAESTSKDAFACFHAELEKCLSESLEKTKKNVTQASKFMAFMLKFPVAVIAAICLLALAATWAWIPAELLNVKTESMKLHDGTKVLVITSPGWRTCEIPDGTKHPCKVR